MAYTPCLFLVLVLPGLTLQALSLGVGINYGQIANNLPSPSRVAGLLNSLSISKVKLYDADPNVLRAFANTNVEFVVGIGNELVANITDPDKALQWLTTHVQPYIPYTKITCITVGNEIFSGNDTTLITNLVPAMQSLHSALQTLGLSHQVNISTAHSLMVLSTSYPPSSGTFKPDIQEYMQSILNFHAETNSPFLINAYPYFAYKDNPNNVPLNYVLFQPNEGVVDPVTGLSYDNMLYAQIDAVYNAIKTLGHPELEVKISETGWPSKGDENEAGATPENAEIYNGNLLKRIEMGQGTPMRPDVPLHTYVFALFNEDLKPGPTSERNYGLYNPDGTPAYNIGLNGVLPGYHSGSSSKVRTGLWCILSLIIAILI
ncbi:hypothetical protein AMTR_s00031p00059420 [Amborella trichopoda]|uniref:glucan endo-1,3-beta-D-glucosidase n=2 Tax=Amborella trichopoda TaxID=13333 RepID=U5D2N6_AMBTC|nr:hypothetical protein AMTR_s00031p00059420 [Amborella trichopoda]